MARYRILIQESAVKEIERIPNRKDRRRVIARIQGLADEARPLGCEKLSGRERYRVRQGVYRILDSILDDELLVHVVKAGHRRDAYRQ